MTKSSNKGLTMGNELRERKVSAFRCSNMDGLVNREFEHYPQSNESSVWFKNIPRATAIKSLDYSYTSFHYRGLLPDVRKRFIENSSGIRIFISCPRQKQNLITS